MRRYLVTVAVVGGLAIGVASVAALAPSPARAPDPVPPPGSLVATGPILRFDNAALLHALTVADAPPATAAPAAPRAAAAKASAGAKPKHKRAPVHAASGPRALLGQVPTGPAHWPTRYWVEMASCPASAGSSCVAAEPCDAGVCTGTNQTDSTAGMATDQLTHAGVAICAAANPDGGTSPCTLTGTGLVHGRVYQFLAGKWFEADYLNQTIPAGCVGAQCCSFGDFPIGVQGDKIGVVAQGIGVSCGTTLDTFVLGTTEQTL